MHARSGAEHDVLAGERRELGNPQAGLDRGQQQRVASPAEEARLVRGLQERLDLVVGEEADGKDPPDEPGVLAMAQRGKSAS